MKRKITLTIFSVFCLIQLFGQQRQMDPKMLELIKTKKVAFITEQVGLTSAEGEKFWPLYNQLEVERNKLMDRRKELEESIDNKAFKTDEEYRKLSIEIVGLHLKESRLIEEYNTRFLTVLSAEKVVKMYRSERKFRSYLMQEFRKKDGDKDNK
ncbi:MAG: hypothetical protein LWW85_02300 [Marinilabiliales bacterium]|nr:hypothetical protein [Marinilabiliales bacterium]